MLSHFQLRIKMFSVYGKISEVKPSQKGYIRLTVSHNVPFKTKHIKFNVWNQELLKKANGTPLKRKDTVFVEYIYKNGYPKLQNIQENSVDNCPVCYSSLEGIDAQRMTCEGCCFIPECDYPKRIHDQMKLVSTELCAYTKSSGYKLEFYNQKESRSFTFVIFKNNVLFESVSEMKAGFDYTVIAWLALDSKFLDVVDICSA